MIKTIKAFIRAVLVQYRLNKIRSVEFKWKKDQNTQVGFVAQTVAMPSYYSAMNKATPYPNSIQFNNKSSADPILTITAEGDVIWKGKPSEAAEVLVKAFQLKIENINGMTSATRRRYYLQACQNLLKAAEQMEHEEFIAFLNKQVYNREHTVIMDALKGNYNEH
jgi:hypothetical protein